MLLGHEHGVEVPESGLDESVRGHLGETGMTRKICQLEPFEANWAS